MWRWRGFVGRKDQGIVLRSCCRLERCWESRVEVLVVVVVGCPRRAWRKRSWFECGSERMSGHEQQVGRRCSSCVALVVVWLLLALGMKD
jgi:hypothetical protein